MKENESEVRLLLTDTVMPQISGIQLLQTLRASYPRLKVILMSGYASEVVERYGPIPSDVVLIQKPFPLDSLLSQIRVALDG